MVAGALSVLPAGAWAAGTTRYVGQAGCNDAGPGTSATAPFCTINAAVKVSGAGDTVDVAQGTYQERVDVAATRTGLVLTGHNAVIDATGALYGFAVAAGNVQLSGFEVDNATTANVYLNGSTGSTVSGVTTSGGGNGVYVLNGGGNTIDHVTVSGGSAVGILIRTSGNNKVTASTTHGNQNHGLSVQGGDGNTISGLTSYGNSKGDRSATGIDVRGWTVAGAPVAATNTIIENSTTYGNEDSGIESYPGADGTTVRRNLTYGNGDHGIDVAGASNATVSNNTIVGNTNVGLNVEASGAGVPSSATVRNNIAANNGLTPVTNPSTGGQGHPGQIRVDEASKSGTTLDYDLVYGPQGTVLFEYGKTATNQSALYTTLPAFQQATGQEQHGVAADPKLGSDYHLTTGSPAIDAGTPAGTDLGAFEFGSNPAPTPPSAALTATPNTLTAGGTSTLDASGSKATAPGASIASYTFSCGNGTAAVADPNIPSRATCTYPQAQTAPYTASVTVTDSNKNTATATATVTVTNAPTAPTAALVATPDKVTTGGSSTLDATASKATATGATITGYAFDCGDNAAATQVAGGKATCTYAKAGTYTAAVTVTDSNKNTAKATATITVADAPAPPPGPGPQPGPGPAPGPAPKPSAPVAQLTALPSLLVAGGAVTLDASGSHATATGATISGYRFDCGTGVTATSGTSPTTLCSYPDAGTYTAKVTVTDSLGGTASATAPVEVTAPQIAAPHARFKLRIKRLSHGRVRVLVLANTSKAAPGAELTGFRFFCGNGHHTRWVHRTYSACTYHPRHRAYRITVRVRDNLGKTDDAWRRLLYRHR
ncbi:MAG: PKD domain-containing protein [Nocardioidaceae bacterium]